MEVDRLDPSGSGHRPMAGSCEYANEPLLTYSARIYLNV
jgi:hypothetical protein